MNAISTIVFDFGGVIINLKSEKDWLLEDLYPNFQKEMLLQLHKASYFHDLETGKIAVDDFLHQMQMIAVDKNASLENIRQHWNAILKDIPSYRVELLQQLKQNYSLILLSNTNAIHTVAFEQYMEQTFGENILKSNFQMVYYSQEIGLRKPNSEIYEFVLEQHNLQPNEVLFFDDKNENLTVPKQLGWHTALVDKDITMLVPSVLTEKSK